jgi:hypothetical protein
MSDIRGSPSIHPAGLSGCVVRGGNRVGPDVEPRSHQHLGRRADDSPEPNGPDAGQVASLLNRLVREPKALGLDVTIYDPGLDPDLAAARILAGIIEQALKAHP